MATVSQQEIIACDSDAEYALLKQRVAEMPAGELLSVSWDDSSRTGTLLLTPRTQAIE